MPSNLIFLGVHFAISKRAFLTIASTLIYDDNDIINSLCKYVTSQVNKYHLYILVHTLTPDLTAA